MNAEGTTGFLTRLAEVFEVEPAAVQPDFTVAGRWDSMAVLLTIALIDEQFDVTVPVDALTGCTSVADVLALVGQNVEHRSPAR
jgi:acyl carrier protein